MRHTRAKLAAMRREPPPLSVHVEPSRWTTLELSWPPSVNDYWRWWKGHMVLTPKARSWLAQTAWRVRSAHAPRHAGPVGLYVSLHPPDRRVRDIDNVMKAIFDALKHGDVYLDDRQVEHLTLDRRECRPGGLAIVRVERRGV